MIVHNPFLAHIVTADPTYKIGRFSVEISSDLCELIAPSTSRRRVYSAPPRFGISTILLTHLPTFLLRKAQHRLLLASFSEEVLVGRKGDHIAVFGTPPSDKYDTIVIDSPYRGLVCDDETHLRLRFWVERLERDFLASDGIVILAGNRRDELDIFGRMNHAGWPCRRWAAAPDLHSERWPAEMLQRLRVEVGPQIWAAQYQQQPMPRETR